MQKRMFGSGTFVWIPIKQNSSYPNRMDPIRNTAINPFCDLFRIRIHLRYVFDGLLETGAGSVCGICIDLKTVPVSKMYR